MAILGGNSGDKRPVFLDLTVIYLPRTALVSILHRVSGIGLILSYPLMVVLLYIVAADVRSVTVDYVLGHSVFRFFMALVLMGSGYHMLAGLRHILADVLGLYDLPVGQSTADVVLLLWVLWSLYVVYGVWL